MKDIEKVLVGWQLDVKALRERMYGAGTPRERERWHAIWLTTQGWSAAQVAEVLERDAHTIGEWLENLRQKRPTGITFVQSGAPPPPSTRHNKRH